MVLGTLHEVTVRFFPTQSRLSTVDEGPYGKSDRFADEGVVWNLGPVVQDKCVTVRKSERSGDPVSIGHQSPLGTSFHWAMLYLLQLLKIDTPSTEGHVFLNPFCHECLLYAWPRAKG